MEDNAPSRKTRRQSEPDTTKLPPHSLEAEQGVLGCLLMSPEACIPEAIEKLKEDPTVLYDLRHQTIYRTLLAMHNDRLPIDTVTVMQHLKDKGQLEAVGDMAYLSSLPDAVPSAANLPYYTAIVRDKWLLRRVITDATKAVGQAYEAEGDVQGIVDRYAQDAALLAMDKSGAKEVVIKNAIRKSLVTIEEMHNAKSLTDGIPTGFTDLDRMTGGLHNGEMIVIAGRPGNGKTSLCMNIAENVAIERKIPVGVFSLEMTQESLVLRMVCSRAKVNLRRVREGFLADRDFPRITSAAGALSIAPLYIDDTPGLTIVELRAKARRMQQQYGIKLFVVDFLQRMHATMARPEGRQREMALVSEGIAELAKELKVPVIAACQLNRELEKEKNRRPKMSDLKETGKIEEDADFIGMLWKPDTAEGEDAENDTSVSNMNLCIVKQRNGPTGDIPLTFLREFTRYESAEKVQDEPELPVPDPHEIVPAHEEEN